MDVKNFNKVGVIGFAKTGISLCNLLLTLGKEVKVTESREQEDFSSDLVNEFKNKGVIFEFGANSKGFVEDRQLLILSPGVNAANSLVVKHVQSLGIPCIGEIEFAYWFNKAKIIAITGTNGKTTTAKLTYQVFEKAFRKGRAFLGGNIGTPFSSFVLDTKIDDIVILEVSSFQLDTIFQFHPFVAVFLNIEPDHLDYHNNLKEYLTAKTNVFKNQDAGDWALINKNINFRNDIEKKINARLEYFSDEFSNENLSCVYKIAHIFGIEKIECLKIFSSFKGFSHRLQVIKKVNGVTFINDSKATNPSSTIWALKNTKGSVFLLAGGKDKGLDFSVINSYSRKIKKLNLYGEAASKIKSSISSNIEAEIFSDLNEAMTDACKQTESGDTILLSPMCASFDQFKNYQERGDKFMEIVNGF